MKNVSPTLKKSAFWVLFGDIVALVAAFAISELVAGIIKLPYYQANLLPTGIYYIHRQALIFFYVGIFSLFWLGTKGHYRHRLPYWEKVSHILLIAGLGVVASIFGEMLADNTISYAWFGGSWTLFIILLAGNRSMVQSWLDLRGEWKIPAILIGTGPSAAAVMHALNREPGMGFYITVQMSPKEIQNRDYPNAWGELLSDYDAGHVFLALESAEFESQSHALKFLVRERLPCSIIPPWLGLPTGTLSQHHFLMHDVLLLHDTNRLYLPVPRLLKRGFDILCSGLALLVLLPVFAFVAVLVRRDGGAAFFMQDRVGKDGKIFSCYKFRSMRVDAEQFLTTYLQENPVAAAEWQKFQKLKNDVRITKIGKIIRKASIDELPQFINVLKGEMSLVGPRPITPEQKDFYGDDFVYYESVRPGITGPWQVSGRNKLTFPERVRLECSYARNWSLWMDIVILIKTLPALLEKESAF